jgi:hypothetical protein
MSRQQFLKMSAFTLVILGLVWASLAAGDLLVRTFATSEHVIVQFGK